MNHITPQVLQTAILLMQKATINGDQAYAYVQTVEIFKAAIREMQTPEPVMEDEVGSNSEATD